MTIILSPEAATEYLRLTLVSFESALIGRTHFEARLKVLRAIADPQGGAALFAADILGDTAFEDEDSWPLEDEGDGEEEVGQSAPLGTRGPYFDDGDHSLALKVVAGTLKGWEFHQADDDFFPSIPTVIIMVASNLSSTFISGGSTTKISRSIG